MVVLEGWGMRWFRGSLGNQIVYQKRIAPRDARSSSSVSPAGGVGVRPARRTQTMLASIERRTDRLHCPRRSRGGRRTGYAAMLAMLFLVLFTTLAVGFYSST